jgi:hypothetical protein
MIDWKNEKTTKNYCGYCNGSVSSQSCNGSCFSLSYTTKETIMKNRLDHCLEQFVEIPKEIEKLKEKENSFKEYLYSLREK